MTDHPTFKDDVDALELLMLRGESSVKTRSSMLSILLLDEAPDFAELRATFERASRQFIRLRQHVVMPAVGITAPKWVVDPDFDLSYHLRRMSAPAPAGLRELLDSASQILMAPMDLDRPLWEIYLVEGLQHEGAKAAVLMKMHHAVSDGMGGLMLLKLLFSNSPDTPPQADIEPPIPQDLDPLTLTRRGLNQALTRALPTLGKTLRQGVNLGKGVLSKPTASLEKLREHWQSSKRILGPSPCQPSPLLMRRSFGRRLDVLEIPLTDIRRCARALDASVNDVYIAAIAGGLQRYHDALNCPHEALPLAMPVSLRSNDDSSGGGNQFAAARINLPLNEADPKKRIEAIRQQTLKAIAEPAINIVNRMAPLLVHLPDIALHELGEMAAQVDVQASNVPGLRETAYLAGSKIVKMYPFGPLPGIPLMLVMMSHDNVCYIGSHCDTAAVRQPELLIQCLKDEFNALLSPLAAPAKSQSPRKKRAVSKAAATPAAPRKRRSTASTDTGKASTSKATTNAAKGSR